MRSFVKIFNDLLFIVACGFCGFAFALVKQKIQEKWGPKEVLGQEDIEKMSEQIDTILETITGTNEGIDQDWIANASSKECEDVWLYTRSACKSIAAFKNGLANDDAQLYEKCSRIEEVGGETMDKLYPLMTSSSKISVAIKKYFV